MKTKLTILCENSVGVPIGVIGEHGFACYVETEKGNYLFDTGQGFACGFVLSFSASSCFGHLLLSLVH